MGSEPNENDEGLSEVKVKKEKLETPPVLNGFDFLNDTADAEEDSSSSKRKKEERRRKEEKRSRSSGSSSRVKEEPKDDGFAKAMEGLTDTFRKPSSHVEKSKRSLEEEDDDEERRRKKAKKEESRSKERNGISANGAGPSLIPDISPHYKGGNSLLPDISPVYQPPPRPSNPILSAEPRRKEKAPGNHEGGDAETFAIILENKAKGMGALYSGQARTGFSLRDKHGNIKEVPRLYDQCIQVLKDNVDSIDETGNLPFDILKPVLEQASIKTLMHIEECNPYLMEDTGDLWEKYERCYMQREDKLNQLKGKVKNCYKAEKEKHRETKMAYADIAPKAPRSVQKAQVKNGTFVATGSSLESVRRSRATDPTAGKNMMGSRKPARAPMMQKAMRMAGKMRR